MIINFLHGRPACGKDSQADLLVKDILNSSKVSGVYRSAFTKLGPYAKYHEIVKPYMLPLGEGIEIPGIQVVRILEGIVEDEQTRGIETLFVCGLLRSLDHLKAVDNLFSAHEKVDFNHIYINTSQKRALEQTLIRFNSDVQNGNARLDDKLDLMKRRLARFDRKVLPMLEELMKDNRLLVVDGEQPIETVNREITKLLYPLLVNRESELRI